MVDSVSSSSSGQLRLSGLTTGIDTNAIITQLMEAEKSTMNIYIKRQQTYQAKEDSLNDVKTKLQSVQNSLKALENAEDLRAFSISSSDSDIVTAEATTAAYEGNHTVLVNQLATAERWVHTAGIKYKEDRVGEGTFIYSYDNKEVTIDTSSTTTLQELAGLINNDPENPGVTASLLYYNDAYHLVLSGNDAGSDYEVKINGSNTELWQSDAELKLKNGNNAELNTKIMNLGTFYGTLEGGEKITINGKKHDGTVVSGEVSVTTDTTLSHLLSEIEDIYGDTAHASLENGKIVVTDTTSGASQMTIAFAYDPGPGNDGQGGGTVMLGLGISQKTIGGSVTADLTNFLADKFTETQSAKDSQIRVDGFPPTDWITRSSNTVDDVISGVTLHLQDVTKDGNGVLTNGEQITLTRDVKSVKDKLNTFITSYNDYIASIKEKTGYNEATKVAGILMGDYVVSTLTGQLRSPLYSQTNGFVKDIDKFLTPAQIGLKLDRDGVLSLDSNVFDEAISKDYMGVLAVIGADKSGTSSSQTIKFSSSSSNYTSAGEYNTRVTVAGGVITSAQIKRASESTWRNMTIDGNTITGTSTFDKNGDPLYAENGLQLEVDASVNGTFTSTVRIKQGFTGAMKDSVDKILKTNTGSINIDIEQMKTLVSNLDDKIYAEQQRLDKKQQALVSKFARLEKVLTELQQQMAQLNG